MAPSAHRVHDQVAHDRPVRAEETGDAWRISALAFIPGGPDIGHHPDAGLRKDGPPKGPLDERSPGGQIREVLVLGSQVAADLRPHINVPRACVEERREDIGKRGQQLLATAWDEGMRLKEMRDALARPREGHERFPEGDGISLHEGDGVSIASEGEGCRKTRGPGPEDDDRQRLHRGSISVYLDDLWLSRGFRPQ